MVDFICMGILELQGAEARVTKWKFLVHKGTRTHDPLIVKRPSEPLGPEAWYIIDSLWAEALWPEEVCQRKGHFSVYFGPIWIHP